MRYATVCSGIEAPSVAWHPLGWNPVFFAEIEKAPSAVLAHRWPQVPNHGDMTKFNGWPRESVDLICAGTPCQSFSVAGLRKGLDDPRGNLTLTYLAILERFGPKWMVWENVPGILSDRTGAFGAFLGGLGQLGYGFAYRVLDAQYFGVPQRRRRVFVVGCAGDWRAAAAVLFERHSLQGHPAPSRETGEGVAGGAARSVAIRGRDGTPQAELGDDKANAILTPNGGRGGIGVGAVLAPELARCVATREGTSQDYETTTMVAHSLRADGFDASEDGTGRGTPLVCMDVMPTMMNGANTPAGHNARSGHSKDQYIVPVAFDWQSGGDVRHNVSEYHTSALQRSQVPAIAFQGGAQQDQVITDDGIVPTLAHSSCTHGGHHQPKVMSHMQVRRLTPRECERLQGFSDDYTLVPYRGKPAADGPRYKALGNSMAVPVVRWIGERINAFESREND